MSLCNTCINKYIGGICNDCTAGDNYRGEDEE